MANEVFEMSVKATMAAKRRAQERLDRAVAEHWERRVDYHVRQSRLNYKWMVRFSVATLFFLFLAVVFLPGFVAEGASIVFFVLAAACGTSAGVMLMFLVAQMHHAISGALIISRHLSELADIAQTRG